MLVQIWFSGRGPEIYRHVEDVDVQEREVMRMTFHQPNPDGIVEILVNFRETERTEIYFEEKKDGK